MDALGLRLRKLRLDRLRSRFKVAISSSNSSRDRTIRSSSNSWVRIDLRGR